MKAPQIAAAAVLALLLAGGGFAAGMTVGRSTASPSPSASGFARFGAGGAGRGQFGAGAGGQGAGQDLVTGQVLSVNDGSLTIQVRQPGPQGTSPTTTSQIVLVGTGTRIVRTVETDASLGDIKPNDQITVVATTDASGALSASAIVLGGNALGGLFPGGRGGGARPSPSPSPSR